MQLGLILLLSLELCVTAFRRAATTTSLPKLLTRTPERKSTVSTHVLHATNVDAIEINMKTVRQINLLVDLWSVIAFPPEDGREVDFKLSDYQLNRVDVKGFLKHFQTCKDCAADRAFLMATQDDDNNDILRLATVDYKVFENDEDDDEWGNFDPDLLGDDASSSEAPRSIFPVEPDDELVVRDSREWVRKMIADFSVCPFTMDPDRAGIPLGGVRYSISRATSAEEAFYRYWQEVQVLLATPEKV